ncbi:MAG: DUF134 domain-containing protein [Sedimentisphaerales bacterium]|nr:DUF134 domain-containing protein [Sedimentisphaerales bacterium]
MPRPRQCRRVGKLPQATYYKPRGVPLRLLECVELTLDELEAVRLADLVGLYQEEAAAKMNVSRQTFGRIVEVAHKKIADALVHGKALSIQGGIVEVAGPGGAARCPRGHGGFGPRRGRCHRRGQV